MGCNSFCQHSKKDLTLSPLRTADWLPAALLGCLQPAFPSSKLIYKSSMPDFWGSCSIFLRAAHSGLYSRRRCTESEPELGGCSLPTCFSSWGRDLGAAEGLSLPRSPCRILCGSCKRLWVGHGRVSLPKSTFIQSWDTPGYSHGVFLSFSFWGCQLLIRRMMGMSH